MVDTTLNLPHIPGGKKLIYTNIEMELTAIADFAHEGEKDPLFKELAGIVQVHKGLCSLEAEEYLPAHALIRPVFGQQLVKSAQAFFEPAGPRALEPELHK